MEGASEAGIESRGIVWNSVQGASIPWVITPALPSQPIAPLTSRPAKGGLLLGEREPKRL